MRLSNTLIEEFEKKIALSTQMSSTGDISLINDVNSKIISDLKAENSTLKQKNTELAQQLVEANAKWDEF